MFIKYQKVRNAVVGTTTAVVGSIAAFFGLQGEPDKPANNNSYAVVATSSHSDTLPPPTANPAEPVPPPVAPKSVEITAESNDFALNASALTENTPAVPPRRTKSKNELYLAAMRVANSDARSNAKGKDVLGPSSPWKLNLYDDNGDGQWDRGKLDYDRDEVDDEKWNFKNGRWEKDGGAFVWSGNGWTRPSKPASTGTKRTPAVDGKLAQYRQAMKIATRRATSKKGKDVLGPSSPWKLNLYDDNGDGQWDRGKLDYNRDEVDDEKWNFKKGRWEKDGGATIWTGSDWEPSGK